MALISIRINPAQFEMARKMFDAPTLRKAQKTAVSKTVKNGNAEVRRQIMAVANIKSAKAIGKAVKTSVKATGNAPASGTITIRGDKFIPVGALKGAKETPKGVVATVVKGQGPRTFPRAFKMAEFKGQPQFVQRMRGKTKHRYVTRKSGKTVMVKGGIGPNGLTWGLPVQVSYAGTYTDIIGNPPVMKRIERFLQIQLSKNFQSQVNWLANKKK